MSLQTTRLLLFILLYSSTLIAQEAQVQIHSPKKLDTLLQKKITLDRESAAKKQFTIQVYYGAFEATTVEMERFETLFPEIAAQLIFETPNYKIRAGSFATEREALAVLTRVKRKFRSAFVLKP